jgi:photosystem II stability/assembly factor-like uncharacterized protein
MKKIRNVFQKDVKIIYGKPDSQATFARWEVFVKTVLLICAVLLNLSPAHAAPSDSVVWIQQQSGVHTALWSVMFTDTLHGWATGDAGALVRTSDGGAHWQKAAAFTSRSIYSVYFINPAVGWLTTDTAQIYQSIDSGASWSLKFFAPRSSFGSCIFLDDSTGLASGSAMNGANMYNEGTIYKTVNSATAWTLSQSYMITVWNVGSFSFPDRSHGWATGAEYLLKTSNGALSWQTPMAFSAITDSQFVKTSGYINTVYFEDTLNGFGIGRNGHIVRTRDGGTSWKLVARISEWPEAIAFADPGHGVIVGEGGAVLTSADSGTTWNLRYPRRQSGLIIPWFRNVVFLTMNNGWLVGDSGIIMKGRFYVLSTVVSLSKHSPGPKVLLKISINNSQALTVNFSLQETGPVSIDLIDVRGRTVASFTAGLRSSGTFSETFSINRTVPYGAYFVTLRGKNQSAYAKMVVVR